MKKALKSMILTVFILIFSSSLIACELLDVPCRHSDGNNDGICDKCEEKLSDDGGEDGDGDDDGDDEKHRIERVTIDGESIEGKCILVSVSDEKFREPLTAAAVKIKRSLEESAGIKLPVSEDASDSDAAIKLFDVPRGKAGTNGFRVKKTDGRIEISTAHHNMFDEAFSAYYNKVFAYARGDEIKLSDFNGEINTALVTYEDFGAVGDGVTDDYAAIKAAHDFANDGGQTVRGSYGKKYVIRNAPSPIRIQTNTDLDGAELIIDSRHITPDNDSTVIIIESHIKSDFISRAELNKINASASSDGLVLTGLESKAPTQKLPFSFGYPCLVHLKNENKRNYIRYGYVDNTGAVQNEVVLIDKDGNIDPSTPLLHDFESITSAVAYRSDIETLRFENVNVTTMPSLNNIYGKSSIYLNRAIMVTRANTVIDNLNHKLVGEYDPYTPVYEDEQGFSQPAEGYTYDQGDGKIYDKNGNLYTGTDIKPFMGYNYNGILRVLYANNVLVKNSVFQARKRYFGGTYDIGATYSNKLVFEDCIQSNFFETDEDGNETGMVNLSKCWGIAGTNYCKNMEYIRSRLTRYDAHAGVTNGKIIDSEIGVLRLIGGGDFLIEGTTVYTRTSTPFQLRDDYGSSFNGTLTVKDTRIVDCWSSKTTVKALISVHKANMDTGYLCYFPNIVIDDLEIDTVNTEVALVAAVKRDYDKNGSHYPTRDVISENVHDPDALFDYYYETRNKDYFKTHPYFSRYLDKLETVDNGGGVYTLILRGIPNQSVYMPPEFIEVKNNEEKSYQLTLYNCDFFENTVITATGDNLKRVNP